MCGWAGGRAGGQAAGAVGHVVAVLSRSLEPPSGIRCRAPPPRPDAEPPSA